MSARANKLLVRRYHEEAVSTCDITRLADFVSPDLVEIQASNRARVGIDGAKEHIRGVRETYPDLQITVEQQIAEGDRVVTRVTARGTHRSIWLAMKPTGKRLEMTAVNIDRVVDGRIVEHGGAANPLEPFLEIGAVRITDPVDSPA